MGSQPISVSLAVSGSVLLSSFADREAETIKNAIDLRGNEGLVVRVDLWATGGT
jgi:hypothetical protein